MDLRHYAIDISNPRYLKLIDHVPGRGLLSVYHPGYLDPPPPHPLPYLEPFLLVLRRYNVTPLSLLTDRFWLLILLHVYAKWSHVEPVVLSQISSWVPPAYLLTDASKISEGAGVASAWWRVWYIKQRVCGNVHHKPAGVYVSRTTAPASTCSFP